MQLYLQGKRRQRIYLVYKNLQNILPITLSVCKPSRI